MEARLILAVALLAATATTPTAAQENFDTVTVRTVPVAKGVYMLVGAGGNIGLSVGDDAVFVVDDQFAPLTPKILAAIAAITPKPVRFVVNTHWHGDHAGGNENMVRAGALVLAQDNTRLRLLNEMLYDSDSEQQRASRRAGLPVVSFSTSMTFHVNGETLVVSHFPRAHTDGDAVVHFTASNVIHTGDLFISGGLPYIDLIAGGSINGLIRGADRLLAMANDNTKFIPGHGPVADKARLYEWRNALVLLRNRMRAEVAKGKTMDQVLADSIAKPYERTFPNGHELFLSELYRELTRKPR